MVLHGFGVEFSVSGGSNGGIGGMHVFSSKGSPDIVVGSRVGYDGGEVYPLVLQSRFWLGVSGLSRFVLSLEGWTWELIQIAMMMVGVGFGGRQAISSRMDLRLGYSYMGINFLKIFLFLSVCLPDPSI